MGADNFIVYFGVRYEVTSDEVERCWRRAPTRDSSRPARRGCGRTTAARPTARRCSADRHRDRPVRRARRRACPFGRGTKSDRGRDARQAPRGRPGGRAEAPLSIRGAVLTGRRSFFLRIPFSRPAVTIARARDGPAAPTPRITRRHRDHAAGRDVHVGLVRPAPASRT